MEASVNSAPVGNIIIELDKVDSTNNYAMGQLNTAPIADGTVYFAHQQTAGKGQRGKSWQATAGENILMSLVLQPKMLAVHHQFILSATIALGVYDFFFYYAGDETAIKWSNDIYWQKKKAGGILIENIWRGNEWTYAVVGIGININQIVFPPDLPNPVSMRQIMGKHFDIKLLIKILCNYLEKRYQQLRNFRFENILQEYKNHLFQWQQPAIYKMKEKKFTAVICDVLPNGKLILAEKNKIIEADFGEIEFII